MTWWAKPLLMTAKGASITFGSTMISCVLALQVEKSANRLFFYWMPHKYATVERAYGLTQEQLDSVRCWQRAENYMNASLQAAPVVADNGLHDDDNSYEVRDIKIGFSSDTIFNLESKVPIETRPQLWQHDMIACSMTG
jgi:hypothetical protein